MNDKIKVTSATVTQVVYKYTTTTVTQVVYKYTTTDGDTFTDQFLAENHQKYLDGDIIECSECHGSQGYMDYQDDDGWKPKKWFECKRCKGKGYLERKVVYE